MVDFTVTKYLARADTLDDAMTLLHDKIETIDNGKTLHLKEIFRQGDTWYAALIYDT